MSLTGLLGISQSGSGTYRGTTYDITTVSLTVRNGSALAGANTVTIFLFPNSIDQAVLATSSDGNCGATTSAGTVPTSAALGQSGTYNVMTVYYGCNSPGSSVMFTAGIRTQTWSYELVDGIPMVCINSILRQIATTSESDCVEVTDATGSLGRRASVIATDANKVTTTLRNY